MSLVFTESWAAFPLYTGGDTATAGDNAARTAHIASFAQWGYTHGQNSVNHAFVVRPDTLFPDRRMLSMSYPSGLSNVTVAASMTFDIPSSDKAFVMGMAVWIPPEYVQLAPNASATYLFAFQSGGVQLFSLHADLTARFGTAVAQSSRSMVVGRVNYLEFRYDGSEVRVWFDDVLVLQASVRTSMGRLMMQVFGSTGVVGAAGALVGAAGRWGFSHMYALLEDSVAPNVRLGPTTRVLGTRPNTDIDVDWDRPEGFTSNAAVVGGDIVAGMTDTLQTENVGATDIYKGTVDSAVGSASMVHGIAIKAQGANLDTTRHSLRALVRVDGQEAYGDVINANSLKRVRSFTAGAIYSSCKAGDGGAFVGLANDSRWRGGDPLDLGTYALSATLPARTTYIAAMARNSAGRVIALTSGDIAYYGDEVGGVVASWTQVTHGAGLAGCDVVVNPADDSFYLISRDSQLIRRSADGGATWTSVSVDGTASNQMRKLAVRNGLFLGSIWPAAAGYIGALRRSTLGTSGWTSVLIAGQAGAIANYFAPVMIGNGGLCIFALGVTSTGVIEFFRSTDNGLTWPQVTGAAQPGASNAVAGLFIEDDGALGGYFVVALSYGGIMISRDGNNWVTVYAGVSFTPTTILPLARNKGFMVMGSAGEMQAVTDQILDTALAPLGGFQKVTQYITKHPFTGLALTGAEAASAEFGMRLSK